jgi:hypothetical protein
MLASEIAQLRDETLMLKSMVLEHAGCGCNHIDEYIKHAASDLVVKSSLSVPGSSPVSAPTSASSSSSGSASLSGSAINSGSAPFPGSG